MQRRCGHTSCHQAALYFQTGVFRGRFHLNPRWFQWTEHGAENGAIQKHPCTTFQAVNRFPFGVKRNRKLSIKPSIVKISFNRQSITDNSNLL